MVAIGTTTTPVRAYATGPAEHAVRDLVGTLQRGLDGKPAVAVLYFASGCYHPDDLAGPIARHFPQAAVMGCSTAGEFTDAVTGIGGISAVALPQGTLRGAIAALGDLTSDVGAGTIAAVREIEAGLGGHLRDLDPTRHLGILLVDGIHGSEELVNETLGNAAPLLDVVGGSAGDDLAFDRTWVAVGDAVSYHGIALMICEPAVPHLVVKSCSFEPSGRRLRITAADVATRTVHSFDGRPAAEAYAEAVGVPIGALDASVWMKHPVGLMIGGQPWIRSPRNVTSEGHVVFYAQIRPGMEVEVMNPTDLVSDTGALIAGARAQLQGHISGAVLFNCILRRLELDAAQASSAFLAPFGGIPVAGFHTYGESWLGHINQTLTGVVFGGPSGS
jgi:hypothetical protein